MSGARHGLWYRLYNGETSYDFVGRWKLWFAVSAAVILVGIISLVTQGLNLGIDFTGGTAYEVTAPGVTVAQARDKLRPLGLADAKIQTAEAQAGRLLRVQGSRFTGAASEVAARQEQVKTAMADLARTQPNQVSVNDVGPSFGKSVTNKARTALVVFFIAIAIYISLRFEWKMALAALAAVVHDILVTVGVYSLSRFEVTPATVVAFLTILGYSLYDTIVVFDKVEENSRGLTATGKMSYGDTVNLSMNQVLMRSLNTSLVAILPIVSILAIGAGVLGATTLKDFGLALLVGLLTGAYSSIFIASPILSLVKEREPRYAALRQRLASGRGTGAPMTPAAAAAMAGGRSGKGARSARVGDEDVDEGDDRAGPPLKPARAGGKGTATKAAPGKARTVPVQRARSSGRPSSKSRKKRRR